MGFSCFVFRFGVQGLPALSRGFGFKGSSDVSQTHSPISGPAGLGLAGFRA